MSVVHYDKFGRRFLVGIGQDLCEIVDGRTKSVVKCGAVPTDTGESKAEGEAFIAGIGCNNESIVVISNNKVVEVVNRQTSNVVSTVAKKRPTSVQVTPSAVIISDKSGDAYSYNSTDLTNQKYLLGHVSVILDMVITVDEKLLITCDRDEKIRVSHFPNCYNIDKYLLHHTEYVLRVLLLSSTLLLSLGGDNQLVLWDLQTATPLQTISLDTGYYSGAATFTSPYLLTCSSRRLDNSAPPTGHVTVYRLSHSPALLAQTSELSLPHEIVSCAVSSDKVVLVTSEPNVVMFDFVDGVLSNERTIHGEHDLAHFVAPVQLESTKVSRTAGFKEYFERKRKRIEEENVKEESSKPLSAKG